MPARPILPSLLVAVALAGASGCGESAGTPAPAPSADAAAAEQATPEPSGPAAAAPLAGTWTTGLALSVVRTDGTRIAGLTRPGTGGPVEAVALSAADGADLWTAPLPAPDGATVAAPSMRLDPGAPVVVSYQLATSGSGLTPAGTVQHVAALDPATGDALWDTHAGGAAVGTGAAAVVVAVGDPGSARKTALALDPSTGTTLWTAETEPVLVQDDVVVLKQRVPGGASTLLVGAEARTGRRLWSSDAWGPGASSSRSFVHASVPGRAVFETSGSRPEGASTSVRVRDLRTGEPVGGELPAAVQLASLSDPTTGTIVLDDGSGEASRAHGVYAVDAATGRVLWRLGQDQSAGAQIVGAGLVWLQGADGFVAVDAVTGKPRAQGLPAAPVLVLPRAQILADSTGLRSEPLP